MDKWDKRFLELAHHVSSWSKDPSTKVGAIIVDSDRNVRNVSYNGFARGVNDTDDRLLDRTLKLLFTNHAESNAIDNCARIGISTANCTLYVTHFPCASCCIKVIQSGISRIVVDENSLTGDFRERWKDQISASFIMIAEAKLNLTLVKL